LLGPKHNTNQLYILELRKQVDERLRMDQQRAEMFSTRPKLDFCSSEGSLHISQDNNETYLECDMQYMKN